MNRMSLSTKLSDCAPPFCSCNFPDIPCHPLKLDILNDLKCRCGENDDLHRLHWAWQQEPVTDAFVKGQNIIFHPTYSQGTSGVRGAKELSTGMVHFWEIRIISVLTGTDIMFGIGTDEVSFERYKFSFVSALGINDQSWGYSFHGFLQHKQKQRVYGRKFSQGCVVGVLLDRIRGHLEFYLNRRPLGIAFTNIPLDPAIKLYPIVCSTAAKSIVRLINSISEPECLQLRAYRKLTQSPKSMQDLQDMPGLRAIVRTYWFFAPEIYAKRAKRHELDLTDEALLSSKRLLRKQKFKENFDEDGELDIYANAHKIIAVGSDSEDECLPYEWFMDEYFNRMP